jgi:hypothetical protein
MADFTISPESYPPRDETLDDLPPEQWDSIRKAFG